MRRFEYVMSASPAGCAHAMRTCDECAVERTIVVEAESREEAFGDERVRRLYLRGWAVARARDLGPSCGCGNGWSCEVCR